MKRLLAVVMTVGALCAPVFGLEVVTFTDYVDGFEDFTREAANALPFNSTVGLNWSNAHIGQFPHFGIGIATGFTTMPFDAFDPVAEMLKLDLPSELERLGAPIPAIGLEGRLGGFILPFDVGLKFAMIPENTKALLPGDLQADYLSLGFDVRYRLVKERGPVPEISVGGGYNYVRGEVSLPGQMDDGRQITGVGGQNIEILSEPRLNLNWATNVIDLKAQASKSLLIITPYIGLGASLGVGSVGGGIDGNVQKAGGGALTPAEVQAIENFTGEDFDPDDGFYVSFDGEKGWSFRTFGGVAFNLAILKLDITGMYNFTSGSVGASVGARVQL